MSNRTRRVILVSALLAFVIAAAVTLGCVRVDRVLSEGMEPALPRGSLAVSCACGDPRIERGHVVVFRLPPELGAGFVKRVAARGGDRVETRGEELYVNGDLVAPPRRAPASAPAPAPVAAPAGATGPPSLELAPLFVAPGFVFVVGDEDTASQDSRSFGPVPESEIVGRVLLVLGRSPDGWFFARRVR